MEETAVSSSSLPEEAETEDTEAFSVTENDGDAEAEAAAEAEKAQADRAAMYAAYLAKLNDYQTQIRNYIWQMADGIFHYPQGSEPAALKPVALADIQGDENPELIFAAAPQMGMAGLHIFGWQDGSLQDLCSFENWDANAASGTSFCLFQTEGDKTLYAYSYIGDEIGFYHCYRFTPDSGKLLAEDAAYAEINWSGNPELVHEDVYTANGQPTDQAGFDAAVRDITGRAVNVVMYSAPEYADDILKTLFAHEQLAMSLDEAVAYLTPLASGASEAGASETSDSSGEFTLDSLQGLCLVFCSGAGAWDTDFTMEAGGAFTGTFHDSDMGSSGDGYDATIYICPFTGRFDNLQKVNDHVYTADIAELNYTYTPGDEWIEEMEGARVLYVAEEAYGLDDCSQVTIYLPGTPISEIPEDALFKVFYKEATLDGVVIYGSGDFYTSEAPAGISGAASQNSASAGASSSEGMLFPDSDTRNLTGSDIAGFTDDQIQQAINEIFARHGYSFKDPDIYAFFSKYSWYHPTTTDMDAVSGQFNGYETANVNFLAGKIRS